MGTKIKLVIIFSFCFMLRVTAHPKPYLSLITVAQDGSADFKTIQEAVNAVRDFSDERVIIRVKSGVYKEKLIISSWKTKISLIGEKKGQTVISNGDYSGKNGINTYTSHTVLVQGNDFSAENITFENTAGPVGQAVALQVEADRCIFKNCKMLGNQDTLFLSADTSRQYYQNCYIEGTTDFIFGAATVVFDHCQIHSKKNSYITAASTTPKQPYGFVFTDCTLTADTSIHKVYLGRPWRPYANVVFIRTQMADHILPAGWHIWNDNNNHKNSFYAEYDSTGPGSGKQSRVEWSKQLSKKEAQLYTLKNIFSNNSTWDPKK